MAGRVIGFTETDKVDHLMTREMLDKRALHALAAFRDEVEMAIFNANTEIIDRETPGFTRDSFMKLAIAVAEARARYIKVAIEVAAVAGKTPPREMIDALAEARRAYDEILHAFQAVERAIERGYISVAKLTKTA
jgi:hypothetical protein